MMDIEQFIARLNPKTMQYAYKGGGQPSLMPSDIAAALSFVPQGLGRSVMEAVYLQDSATQRGSALLDDVMAVVMPKLTLQAQQLYEAVLDVQLIQAAIQWTRANPTAVQREALAKAQQQLETLKMAAWPKNTIERIPQIVKAIIHEITENVKHPDCHNCAYFVTQGECASCSDCARITVIHHSYRKRAKAINCNEKTYLRHWKPVYEWLYQTMKEHYLRAGRVFKKALADPDVHG